MFNIKNKTPIFVTTNNKPINATKIKSAFENVADADIDIIDNGETAVVRFGDVVVSKSSHDFTVFATGVLDGNGNKIALHATDHYPRACLGNMLYIGYN